MKRYPIIGICLLAVAILAGSAWAQNGAQYISDTIPATMDLGVTYTPTVTMKNTGATTWTDNPDYNFGPPDVGPPNPAADWGPRTDVGGSVAPNEEHVFTLSITPNAIGVYDCRWRMVQEQVEWFGDEVTKTITVQCGTAPTDEYFVSETFDPYSLGTLQPQGPPAGSTVAAWNVQAGANTTQATVVAGGVTGNAMQIWYQPGNGPMNIGNGSFPTSMRTNVAHNGHPNYNNRVKLQFKFKPLTSVGAEFWAILCRDNSGTGTRSYVLVIGSDTGITAWDTDGGDWGATYSPTQSINNDWHLLEMIVDIREPDGQYEVPANKVHYYLDGAYFWTGVSDGGNTDAYRIRQIDFWQYSPVPAASEQKILIDDLRLGSVFGLPTNTITSPDSFATTSPTFTWDRTWFECDITDTQVIICDTNDPNAVPLYDSGWVAGANTSQVMGPISEVNQNLYVFQRDRIAAGPQPWSEGKLFQIIVSAPTKPVITAPTGTITTCKPHVVFTADAHASIQMKVFTSNVTDPENDPSYYDSGVLSSPGNSCVSGVLANGTYWAFVKVGNVVGWSPWSDGQLFTVNYNPSNNWVDLLEMDETVPDLLDQSSTWNNPGGTAAWTGPVLTDPSRQCGFIEMIGEPNPENEYSVIDETGSCNMVFDNKIFMLNNPGDGNSHNRSMRMHKCQDEIDLDRGVTFAWEQASIREQKGAQHGGKTWICGNVYVCDKDPAGNFRMVSVRCWRSSVGMVSNQLAAMMTGTPDGPGFTTANIGFSESFRRYRLTGRNQVAGDYNSTKWTLYVNDVETLTTYGTFVDNTYEVDFVAIGLGESNVHGSWLFDWIAVNGGGDFAPGEWDPMPSAGSTYASIGDAKKNVPDNRAATITGPVVITKVVTHEEMEGDPPEPVTVQDGFYVQDAAGYNNVASGIFVETADTQSGAVVEGAKITSLSGTLYERTEVVSEQTLGGRAVKSPSFTIEGTATYPPLGMAQKNLMSPCVSQNLGSSLDTLGMLVRIFGKVTLASFTGSGLPYFYVDDGSGAVDDRDIGLGMRIVLPIDAPVIPTVGDYVMVEGWAAYEITTGGTYANVRTLLYPTVTQLAVGIP